MRRLITLARSSTQSVLCMLCVRPWNLSTQNESTQIIKPAKMMGEETRVQLESFAQLQEAFKPYVYPEQQVKDIRNSLLNYLQGFVVFADEKQRLDASLPNPNDVVAVKPASREVTGTYRRYLESLKANLAARNRVNETHASFSDTDRPDNTAHAETEDILEEHVRLLQERERLQKLQILHHYLGELRMMETTQDDFRDCHPKSMSKPMLESQPQDLSSNGYVEHGLDAGESLTEKLELTVLNAKSQMERQQELLRELKSQAADLGSSGTRENRLKGLAKSRDELHSWVQDKLASTDSVQNESEGGDIEPLGARHNSELKESELKVQYGDYCKTRKRMIELASTLNEPLVDHGTATAKTHLSESRSPDRDFSLSPLPFITSRLFRASELETQLGNQARLLSEILDGEQNSLSETLGKLRDESHLLPSYPILANQDRFRDLSNVFRRGKLQDNGRYTTNSDVHEYVNAWKFASAASATELEVFLRNHFSQAEYSLHIAEESLDSLQDQARPKAQARDNGVKSGDVWTAEIEAGMSNLDTSGSQDVRGPWAGLNGRIGIS